MPCCTDDAICSTYILTIYRIVDDIEVEYQQASQDERILKAVAVKWAQNYGWKPMARSNL